MYKESEPEDDKPTNIANSLEQACTNASNQNNGLGELSEDKLALIKKIPKIQLEQMGYGHLHEVINQDEDFLSQSSVFDDDFELLMKDDFFDIVKDI